MLACFRSAWLAPRNRIRNSKFSHTTLKDQRPINVPTLGAKIVFQTTQVFRSFIKLSEQCSERPEGVSTAFRGYFNLGFIAKPSYYTLHFRFCQGRSENFFDRSSQVISAFRVSYVSLHNIHPYRPRVKGESKKISNNSENDPSDFYRVIFKAYATTN